MTDQIVRLGPEYFPRPTSGIPVAGGSIYIGEPDTDPEVVINQIQVSALQENGSTVPISQPILTGGGGVPLYNGSPVTLLVSESYSLKILDSFSAQVYYVPSTVVPVETTSPAVDYVADMIGLINVSSPVDDQTHAVLSYFDGLNSGGGSFYWDSTVDKATANGGTVVDPDNIGGFDGTIGTRDAFLGAQGGGVGFGCWMRISEIVYVEFFGTVADGIINDNAAIQSAIDSIDTGGELLVGSGDFLFTGVTITEQGVSVRGTGNISSSTLKGTTFIKDDASTAIGFDCSGADVRLSDFSVDGQSGNTNLGIQFSATRPSGVRLSVFNQGGSGIRLGTDSTDNVNLWYLENIIADGNGIHGIHIHSNTAGNPDVNGGTLINLDTRNNTSDGLFVDNAWLNAFIGCTAQVNTGYGLRFTSDSVNNRVVGGDQDEVNVAGNILNEGEGNVFIGTSDVGFTDNGTETVRYNRTLSKCKRLGLGIDPTGNELLVGQVSQAGIETIQRWDNIGNAAADRGYSFDYDLPVSGSSATGVKQIIARLATNESSYIAWQVKLQGSALADTFRLDSSITAGHTRMLIYDVDNGTLERVSVGAADSGGAGFKVLRIPN